MITEVKLTAGKGVRKLPLLPVLPALTGVVSAAGVVFGILLCCMNNLENYAIVSLALVSVATFGLQVHVYFSHKKVDKALIITAALCLFSISVFWLFPQGLPATLHIYRSFVAAIFIIAVSMALMCSSLYRMLGSTPQAYDRSRYPIIILPIVIAMVSYGLILFVVCVGGIPRLSWGIISTPYDPSDAAMRGILNDIAGTFILMLLTSLISLPIGVGAGIYMSEYGGKMAELIKFSTTLLRAMPVVVMGLAAYGVATAAYDSPLQGILAAYPTNQVGRGTFLLASIFLSLLVIPVIARSTEEGLRSLPRDMREGSLAVGATEGYTLLNILLPWTLPNVLTGLLLGCAEVAGSVTVIVLLCGYGNFGVSPLSEATSLSHFIYRAMFASREFHVTMGPYVYAAALILLMITLGLTVGYLALRQKFAERYRAH